MKTTRASFFSLNGPDSFFLSIFRRWFLIDSLARIVAAVDFRFRVERFMFRVTFRFPGGERFSFAENVDGGTHCSWN